MKRPSLTILLLYIHLLLIAQEGELQQYKNGFYIKQFSEASGLLYNGCTRMFQDSRGFLWIGTFSGLSRFDGKEFVNYGVKDGLPGTNIIQISEDSSGLIYVATSNGVARYKGYDKNSNTCFYTYAQINNLTGISGMQPVDSNTIFFQKDSGSVYLLKKNKVLQLTPNDGLAGSGIYRYGTRYIYAAGLDTLRVFDANGKIIQKIFWSQSTYSFNSMDNLGNLYLYSNGKNQTIKGDRVVQERQLWDSIRIFASTDSGKTMFYEQNGVIKYFDGTHSVELLNLKQFTSQTNWLIQARDGSVWASTSDRGMFRITRLAYTTKKTSKKFTFSFKNGKRIVYDTTAFNKVPVFTRIRDSLSAITRTILIDRKGNAWFCTKNGLYRQPPKGAGQAFVFPGNEQRWANRYCEIANGIELPNGELWFNGIAGIVHYKNDTFKHYTGRNGLQSDGYAWRMSVSNDGTVLVASVSRQLSYISGNRVIPAINATNGNGFSTNSITTDDKGYVWFQYGKAIYKLEKQANSRFALTDSIVPPEINTAEINVFEFDFQGNCWVTYTGGLLQVFFVDNKGQYHHTNSATYTKDDGLGLVGGSNNIPVLDDKGNVLFIPLTGNLNSIMYFSVADALNRKRLPAPSVSITGIEVNQEKADRLLFDYKSGVDDKNVPQLAYNENDILFNYNSTSLSHPASVVYKIMLDGNDNKWQVTNSTTAYYTNLSPGDYTFQVQAANVNGAWGPVFKYKFTVRPPWYKTWWATIIWIAAFTAILYLILLTRLNAARMHHLEESSLFKSSLIGLIGHDMVTPLLYIAKVSLQLRTYNERLSKETMLESLGEINTTATQLHFFGESLVHWIKIQKSDFKPMFEKFCINLTVSELANFHLPLATEKGNQLHYETNDDLYGYQDPTLVRIIIHNLLLNANKFTANGKIVITTSLQNELLTIHVRDSGRGMDEAKVNSLNNFRPIQSSLGTSKEKGWGMGYKVIMDLLKFTGGKISITSKLNQGTDVSITLPFGAKDVLQKESFEFSKQVAEYSN